MERDRCPGESPAGPGERGQPRAQEGDKGLGGEVPASVPQDESQQPQAAPGEGQVGDQGKFLLRKGCPVLPRAVMESPSPKCSKHADVTLGDKV